MSEFTVQAGAVAQDSRSDWPYGSSIALTRKAQTPRVTRTSLNIFGAMCLQREKI